MRTASTATLVRAFAAFGVAAFGAVALGGCGGEPAAPGTPPDVPFPGRPTSVLITGVVVDSVTRDPVAGATVIANDVRTATDAAGRFSVRAPSAFVALQVLHPAYADYRRGQTVARDSSLVVALPPVAPYTWSCRVAGDSVAANVTDLQGRKTIVRRDTSGVVVVRGGGNGFQTAFFWSWTPIDSLTYRVRLRVAGGAYDSLRWRIYDAKGHVLERHCAVLPGGRDD